MEQERPTLAERPCPVCGSSIEPLRAREVLLLEDGFRFLCDADCRRRFSQGERDHDATRALARSAGAQKRKKRAPTPPPPMPRTQPPTADRSAAYRALEQPSDPPPWLGLAAAGLALLLGALATHQIVAVLSTVAVGGAVAYALSRAWPVREEIGWLAWLLPPAGAMLAAIAALLARTPDDDARLWLVGAAVAAATVVVRTWLDVRSSRPVQEVMRSLRANMPMRVRVPRPTDEWATEVPWDEAPAAKIRTGEEILVGEGEVVAVDGIVKAGEAYVLLYPSSRISVRRVSGDPLLAGAVVTDGEVRVLASRVGDERALVRPQTFGKPRAGRSAVLTRNAARILRWGGLAALVGGSAALLLATGSGIAMQLAAVAAVLLAAPFVSVRRASSAPYEAAGATAAERGIAFADARSLDRAGRTGVAALCTHGTVTEGEPEVVEIHSVDDTPWEPVVAIVAGAEAIAEDHAIARALLRFCERRSIEPSPVRLASFSPGKGVTATTLDGDKLVVGNRALLLEEGVSVAVAEADATRAEQQGHTVLFVGFDGHARAIISLRDEDRPGARAAVQRLIDLGVEVVLVSGDHRGTVEALARRLDISHVKAELLPEERGQGVEHLRETHGLVAAIGRPGHDDEALEAADVSVALGAAGAVGGERGVSLSGDDVRDAAAALWLARAARRAAWRGTLVAALGGGVLVVLAATGIAAPAVAALIALGIDAYSLPSASRLLHRIELRLPARG